MKKILCCVVIVIFASVNLRAQSAPAAAELTQLLNEFLAGASHNDVAMHDRFWAEDVIYTGSAGRRRGKADIMKDVFRRLHRNPATRKRPTLPKTCVFSNTATRRSSLFAWSRRLRRMGKPRSQTT